MSHALLSLGSNLGDRRAILNEAVRRLQQTPGIERLTVSSFHATQPVGGPSGQGEFLNGAVLAETSLTAEDLLSHCQRIEFELGRERRRRWDERTLDLDLLLFDDAVMQTPSLVLPHPRMAFRRFVLAPAAEIAPHMKHPLIGWTVRQLLEHLDTASPLILICGFHPLRQAIAEQAAVAANCRFLVWSAEGDDALDATAESSQEAICDVSGFSERADSKASFRELRLRARLAVLIEGECDASRTRLQDQLRNEICQPGLGPWLTLSTEPVDRAVEEVVAAVCAMR